MKNKLIFIIITFLYIFFSCDYITLERDNQLDPQNPESYRARVSFVELFVNEYQTNNTICGYAEEAVRLLAANEFKDKIIVLQYHVHRNSIYADTYSTQAASVDEFLNRYDLLRNQRDEGLPDIFVNGIYDGIRENNVQGASSAASVRARLNTLLNSESSNANFTIEGGITKTSQPVLSITVAKLGSGDASGLTLKSAVLEDIQADNLHHYVVRDLLTDETLTLNAAETKSFTKDECSITPANPANIYGAVWIENSAGLVLQSAFIR